MLKRLSWSAPLLVALMLGCGQAAAVDIDAFVKKDRFETLKISPTGEYFAATVPLEDRTVLAILRRADNKLVSSFNVGKYTHVSDFDWVNPERVLISVVEKFGSLDTPQSLGEIYTTTVTGNSDMLVGQRMNAQQLGSNIKQKKAERVAAYLVDDLPNDDQTVLIAVVPFANDPYTRLEKMNVDTGRRVPVARAPVRNARFIADNKGEARFATGVGSDNVRTLHYRASGSETWTLINNEFADGHAEYPIGFSADDATAYLQVEHESGPDSIVALDIASNKRTQLLRDDNTDPHAIIYRPGTSIPVGAIFHDGKPRAEFFDRSAPEARMFRSLQAAFPGDFPTVTSSSADGRLTLVQTYSDRNPGDFYIFDSVAKKADHVISRSEWFDPAKMAETRPISLSARDGTPLAGFLTLPPGSSGKSLPLVVMPHGGPFGIHDQWGFDTEPQLLAAAGYAVLQVNFRGSGNYGRAFRKAGARQWGGTMQDDVTDATRWAIQQGHADPARICIYGASYGGYAALMGVAKEPALYRCAAGYVGVYDLPLMHKHGDIQGTGRGEAFLDEWLGKEKDIEATSPARLADRIKVPVFLAAGGEDQRAPIAHSEKMERALKAAGVPVETLYYPKEGHGFYEQAHRKAYYEKLLAFFGRHLGPGATPPSASAAAPKSQ